MNSKLSEEKRNQIKIFLQIALNDFENSYKVDDIITAIKEGVPDSWKDDIDNLVSECTLAFNVRNDIKTYCEEILGNIRYIDDSEFLDSVRCQMYHILTNIRFKHHNSKGD